MPKGFAALWLAMLLSATPVWAQADGPHLALVIANGHYPSLPPLTGCDASGTTVAAALRRTGWVVSELRDPSNGQVGAAIGTFADAVSKAPDASVVLYFCGYAGLYENRLFLLPASARLQRPTDILTEGIVTPSLTRSVSRSPVRAGLAVLDLVAMPGPVPPLATAAFRDPADSKGLFATVSGTAIAGAPSPAAAALAALLARPTLTVADALAGLKDSEPASAVSLAQPSEKPAWLQGAPPPPPPPAAPAPVEPPAPVVAPVAPPAAPSPEAPTPSTPPPVAAAPNAAAPVAVPPVVAPLPSGAKPVGDGPATLGDLDRRRVQLALQRLGYYAGKVDGTFGAESLAAIRRYQHELGGEMTGRLTEAQAARLLSQP